MAGNTKGRHANADGVCDAGRCPTERTNGRANIYWAMSSGGNNTFPDGRICLSPSRDLCDGGGTCGVGGDVEDPDCPYDYEFRDSIAGHSGQV